MHVDAELIATLSAVAAAAGFIDAIAGGGGLLTLPALLASGLPPVQAIATSKLQSSLGTATAAAAYGRRGQIDWRGMALPAGAAAAGAVSGSLTLQVFDPGFLKALTPLMLIAIALYFLLAPRISDSERKPRLGLAAFSVLVFAIGFYDGFFGPGTGAFLVLSLVTLMGLGLVRATANTKLLNLASNIGSFILLAAGGHVVWPIGLGMAAGGILGGQLGAMTALKVGPRLIRPLLVVVSLALTIKLLMQPDNPLAALIFHR